MSENEGRQQRDIGMARAELGARPSQKVAAKHAIAKVCRSTCLLYTSDAADE